MLDERSREIANPHSGERIIIRTSGAQTDGRLLVFDVSLPPGGHVPTGHVHRHQVERFTVLRGRLRFRMGWRTVVVHVGQSVTVPAGAAHWFGNPGPGAATARVEVQPALRTEDLLRASARLGPAGGRFGVRLPSPGDLARLLLEFRREVSVPHVPAVVTDPALRLIDRLTTRRGG